jgi:hypothetical protein
MFDDRPSAWVPKRLGFDGVVANIMGGLYEPACSAVIPFFIPSPAGLHLPRRPRRATRSTDQVERDEQELGPRRVHDAR